MTLITEMMQRPLDPGYAAAAESRQKAGLPPATGHQGPMLVLVAVLIGASLAGVIGALAAIPVAGGIQVLILDWQEHRRTRLAALANAPPAEPVV